MKTLFFLALFIISCHSIRCIFDDENGKTWNLTQASSVQWSWSVTRDGNTENWYIGLCTNAYWCPTTDGTCGPNNGVCQTWRSSDPNGDPSTYSAIILGNPYMEPRVRSVSGGVSLEYFSDSQGMPTAIRVLCPISEHHQESVGSITKDNTGTWIIPLYHDSACPNEVKPTFGPGGESPRDYWKILAIVGYAVSSVVIAIVACVAGYYFVEKP